MIRAVIFDIDGVLIDSVEANLKFYQRLLARHGYAEIPPEELHHGHYLSMRDAIAYFTRGTEEEVQTIYEVGMHLEDYPVELVSVPEGCGATLTSLKKDYSLAIVSARPSWGIEHFFSFTGLREAFGLAVGYEDYSRAKPHPEPLTIACERLGVLPSEAVYVGDAPTDYQCAQAAGCQFIAFGPLIPDSSRKAESFSELESLIRAL